MSSTVSSKSAARRHPFDATRIIPRRVNHRPFFIHF
jgi:hypothetical protein